MTIYNSVIKDHTRRQWNNNPCGTGDFLEGIPVESLEYFDAIRHDRYYVSNPWIMKHIPFNRGKNSCVLEIGYGIGSDLLTFATVGAEVSGVDLTPEHYRLAKKNFELHGVSADLRLGDASCLEFPSNYFDLVYSLGVLHHTPDTVRCISEAYRVLKPGGVFVLGLYRRYSAFHIFSMLLENGLLGGKLYRLGYAGLMATLEKGADGIEIKPLVKTYTSKQLKYILSDFSYAEFTSAHFDRDHLARLKFLMPKKMESWFEKLLGWYLIAYAVK